MEWPEEYELLSFFETDPVESNPSDGFWCYETSNIDGRSLRFSFNSHERSIQTTIMLNGNEISTVSH